MVVYFVILPYILSITSITVGDDMVQYESKERNIMDNNTWNMKKTQIEEWMSANDTSTYPALAAVEGLLAAGSVSDSDTRENLYAAIRQCFKGVDNTPLRKGRGSNLPADVEAAISAEVSTLRNDLLTCWEASPSIQNNIMQHGRSGGGTFGSGADYADYHAKIVRKRLVDGYKAAQEGKEADYHTVISDGVAITVHQGVA
jgi:hypothetical protein